MKTQKIIILTGNDTRHQFFIHHLNAKFSISEIYIEKSTYPFPCPQSKEESVAWNWFFQRRDRYEKKLVLDSGQLLSKNKPRMIYLDENELNSPHTIIKIEKTNPRFIAVFGVGILREPFLKKLPNRLFNMLVTRKFIEDRHAISGLFTRESFNIYLQPYIELTKVLIRGISCSSRLS